jgi:glycosyltransferase involved in cell wall biosynthesis
VVSLGGLLTNILKIRISEKKIINLPNGTNIPAEYTRQTDDNHINIFFISRFASNKGIDILLEVADELNREGQSNITYILGGKGPLFEPLKQKYTAENIRFLGFVSDEQLSVLYIKSDLFVLPTLFEGMPTVVLEAMSYKLPVIVSNVGATAELVDESNGWLISKNSKSELKNAILRFISLTPQQRTGLGENSYKKFAENFTWTQIAQKHIDFFQSIK